MIQSKKGVSVYEAENLGKLVITKKVGWKNSILTGISRFKVLKDK